MVPIGTVAQLQEITVPYRVPRYNLYPAAEVQGVAAPGVSTGTALSGWRSWPPRCCRPASAIEWTELAFQQEQKGNADVLVFGAAALFVFLVLAAQYESWKLPLAVVLIVPMCLLARSPACCCAACRSTSWRRSASWCWSAWRRRTRS